MHPFWDKVSILNPDECWEWTGARNKKGYGRTLRFKPLPTLTHRISYTLTYGPIPPSMLVCHRCDNPACCNPQHLFLGTPADNSRDMSSKGRARNSPLYGESHPQSKLTQAQVLYIRESDLPGVSLALELGVTPTTICRVRRGRGRKSDPGEIQLSRRISTHSQKITDTQALEIRSSTKPGSALAKEYGLHVSTISKIRLGKARTKLSGQD